MLIPNSLTIPSPYPSPLGTLSLFPKSVSCTCKFWKACLTNIIHMYLGQVFSALKQLPFSATWFFVGAPCPIRSRRLSNISDLCSLDTSSTLPPNHDQQSCPQILLDVTCRWKSPSVEKLFFRKLLLVEVCWEKGIWDQKQGNPWEGSLVLLRIFLGAGNEKDVWIPKQPSTYLCCQQDCHESVSYLGFLSDSVVKNPPANACATGDAASVPRSGRSPGGGNDQLTPVFLLEESHGCRSLAVYSPRGSKTDRHDLAPKEQQQNVIFIGALKKDHGDLGYLEGSAYVSFFDVFCFSELKMVSQAEQQYIYCKL